MDTHIAKLMTAFLTLVAAISCVPSASQSDAKEILPNKKGPLLTALLAAPDHLFPVAAALKQKRQTTNLILLSLNAPQASEVESDLKAIWKNLGNSDESFISSSQAQALGQGLKDSILEKLQSSEQGPILLHLDLKMTPYRAGTFEFLWAATGEPGEFADLHVVVSEDVEASGSSPDTLEEQMISTFWGEVSGENMDAAKSRISLQVIPSGLHLTVPD